MPVTKEQFIKDVSAINEEAALIINKTLLDAFDFLELPETKSSSEVLICLFDWHSTDKRYTYWCEIHEKLISKEAENNE